MSIDDRIDAILRQFEYLEARLGTGLAPGDYADAAREYAALEPTALAAKAHRAVLAEVAEAEGLLDDPEMAAMAREELERLSPLREAAEAALRRSLIPRDAADAKSAILEIRPGTGGDEAALFAGDLFRMYQRYAEGRGWKVEIVSLNESDLGGIRELVAGVRGAGVFARLKFESGTHRVQRVPETESGGRIHTSAATVAVLPEAQDIDITINESDLRIDTMRASGAGGQHVNTTDSAVRMTHIPSGIVVTASEKSQHQNRARAMEILRARLYDQSRREADEARAADRKAQVGSGDRSERIRTYNFPQGRVTDHRIGLTLYKLDQVLAGDMDEIVDALTEADQAAKLAGMDA